MPTVHYVERKFLKQKGLRIDWCISDKNTVSHNGNTLPQGKVKAIVSPDERKCATTKKKHPPPSDASKVMQFNPQNNNRDMFNGRRSSPPVAAGLSDLKRKSNEVIWVREGKTEHPAYELQSISANPNNDTCNVEWVSNGKRECIYKEQIVKNGLQARKRQRPNYL